MRNLSDQIQEFIARDQHVMLVRVEDAKGSTPRDVDAFMLVSADGVFGTIGGGQLEYMAIDDARRALREGHSGTTKFVPLGPQIGQCCGGQVTLSIDPFGDAEKVALLNDVEAQATKHPHVLIFGAGHVGRALTSALVPLPFQVMLVDEREHELALDVSGVKTMLHMLPERVVQDAPAHSAFVVATHDHALDFQITRAALARDDVAYVGMIGSKTKRSVFSNWLEANGEETELLERLICPIGGKNVGNKRPEAIAALVAAELLFHTQNCEWDRQSPKVQQTTNLGVA